MSPAQVSAVLQRGAAVCTGVPVMPPAWHKAPSVTKAFEWREGCTGKRAFESPQVARTHLHGIKGGSVYKCPRCHAWHYTSQEPRR